MLALVAIATALFATGFVMSYPLLLQVMANSGFTSSTIGFNSAMLPLGILLSAPLVPLVSKKIGPYNLMLSSIVLFTLCMPAYWLLDNIYAWFGIRLLQGIVAAPILVISEAVASSLPSRKHRGKFVALYTSLTAVGASAGVFTIVWVGTKGGLPFLLCTLILGTACMLMYSILKPLCALYARNTPEKHTAKNLLDLIKKCPLAMSAILALAITQTALFSLLPLYAIRVGMSETLANLTLFALLIGNIMLQLPLGWLLDRLPKRLVLAACCACTMLGLLLTPLVIGTPWMWPILVVAGATGYGIYTTVLSVLGSRFRGHDLIQATTACSMAWAIGALFGSASGGMVMDLFLHGLPLYLGLMYLPVLFGLLITKKHL